MYLDEKYLFFTGSMLSNWAEGKFTATLPDGTETEFTSAEQHMMASKAVFFNDMESLEKIMSTNDPSRQKSIGRKVKNFKEDAWLDASFDIVAHGVYSKFSQIPEFREGLLETGDRILVEAAPWDKIWGIGRGEKLRRGDTAIERSTRRIRTAKGGLFEPGYRTLTRR